MTERSSPDSAIRPLREDEVIALHDLADNGGLICDCESSPELCHCSTIMMLCDEWRAMRASVKPDVAQAATVTGDLVNRLLVAPVTLKTGQEAAYVIAELEAENKRLRDVPQEVRNAVIEECAKVADDEQARAAERQKIETEKNGNTIYGLPGVLAALIAARIRELKLNSLSRPQSSEDK